MADPPDAPVAKRWLQGSISVVLVAFIFGWALPRLADYRSIWEAARALSGNGLVVIVVAAVLNLVTYWWVLVVSLPGLTFPQAAVAHQASTAVAHSVPAGGAIAVGLSYAMYTSWGFTRGPIARSVLVTGLWNNLAKFAFPVVALALLVAEGSATPALVATATLGLVLLAGTVGALALAVRSDGVSRALGRAAASVVSTVRRWFGASPVSGWEDGASRFRTEAGRLLAARGWHLTIATLASHAAIFGVLAAALWGLEVGADEVSWIEALAAFSFVRLASALPVTPGGLGVVELGLLAVLTAGDGSTAKVAAAILIFRFVTFVLPVITGGGAYVVWRRLTRWRGPSPEVTS